MNAKVSTNKTNQVCNNDAISPLAIFFTSIYQMNCKNTDNVTIRYEHVLSKQSLRTI